MDRESLEYISERRCICRFIAIWFIVLAVFLPAQYVQAQSVSDWRFGDKGKLTRFVLDIDDIGDHKAFTLNNPSRLVIDIEGGKWNAPARKKSSRSTVKSVRHGIPKKGTLRIVVDLNAKAKIKNSFFMLPGKNSKAHRLIVDFATSAVKTTKSRNKSAKKKAGHYPDKLKPLSLLPGKRPNKLSNKNSKETTKSRRKPTIIIDAGHGGIDPGAISKSGRYEKDITLRYAMALRNSLQKTGRYNIILTRSRDSFVKLSDRVRKARKADADLFISLHADSHNNPRTRGLSVYTISSGRAEREARKIERDPSIKKDLAGINLNRESKDVQEVLIDMVQRETRNTSSGFAEILVKELGSEAKLLRNTHRFGSLAVLTNADIPSVLVELGYMSNRSEARLLATSKHRKRLVGAMKDSISRYFAQRKDL